MRRDVALVGRDAPGRGPPGRRRFTRLRNSPTTTQAESKRDSGGARLRNYFPSRSASQACICASDADERRNAERRVAGDGRGRAGDASAALGRACWTAAARRRAGGRPGGAVRAAASLPPRRLGVAGGGAARGALWPGSALRT